MPPLLDPPQEEVARLESNRRNARLRAVASLGAFDRQHKIIQIAGFVAGALPVSIFAMAVIYWAYSNAVVWDYYHNIKTAMCAIAVMLIVGGVILFSIGQPIGRFIAKCLLSALSRLKIG